MPALAVVPPMSNEMTSSAPDALSDEAGGDHARGAARLDGRTGRRAASDARHHAAARVHDLERRRRCRSSASRALQPGEVAGHHRPDVRRDITVVMARSYSRISGQTSEDATTNASGQRGAQCARDGALVLGVGVGVQQADGDRRVGASPATRRRDVVDGVRRSAGRSTAARASIRSRTSNVSLGSTGGGAGVKKRS